MNLIKSSLRYPVVALFFATLLFLIGMYAFSTMPKTEDPSITIRTGLILAQYPGATAEQVEKQVTKTLEKHIFKFPEVRKEKTFSTSRHGFVVINVELEDDVSDPDLFWAKMRHEMNETAATELPAGVRGPLVKSDFGDTVAMLVAIHGPRYGYRELQDYVDRIQDELRKIRTIGKMARYGGQSEQVWVTSSMERISQHAANPGQIIQALQQQNVITSAGSLDAETLDAPLHVTGAFDTEEDIRNVLVNVSPTGQPVYIRDIAEVTRRYQEPTFLVRYNGAPCIMLSIEMQKGKNIVDLGARIGEVFARLDTLLPPDLALDIVADQPTVVKERIRDLSHEFLLAIGSVILVTMVLLPFRVALVSAVAIPLTLATTLGIMNAFGIALHQVSIAALIVVLGIIVDDAIVIADNYVELLDRKVPRPEAAWRSATEVVVPVFTATITIVCSFLPLLILSGSTGEFIRALPLTVATALGVSFVVAVLLTPILCRFFVRSGLHDQPRKSRRGKEHRSLLDRLQSVYAVTIAFLMGHKGIALALAIVAIVSCGLLFPQIPQQFFPSAERDQFVIDVWLPQGSRIEATDAALQRIESALSRRDDIVEYASFVGQSAPRFYYNVNPQQPDTAYGQLIVNTRSLDETPAIVEELSRDLALLVPEAMVVVKELQQGNTVEAPVEIRISGDKLDELKGLAAQIRRIISAVPFSRNVHQDFYNDAFMADVSVDSELANRLGLTNAMVARTLSGSFSGLPVSVFWEGDRPVTILLKLDAEDRRTFDDVKNAYVSSPLTGASVPLRSIATLSPEWETGRIVRRNGVRTITVRSFVTRGHYASELLKAVQPQLEDLALPTGYQLFYGGEKYNKDETLPKMVIALGISLLAIFIVLLLQFRNILEPLVIMCSIPLMLPGAVVGLYITGNAFGFTAFVGLISLCGIVVRNAIILVDYINEKIAAGHALVQAATEAGERRLRPIFLTTMAAAVGVTPMILSGSSLWSPLASVIAVGLFFSMFFTLLVVPVIYVLLCSRLKKNRATGVAAAILLFAMLAHPGASEAAAARQLTLNEAIRLALANNNLVKIAAAKVLEDRYREDAVRSDYYPHLSDEMTLSYLSNRQVVQIPAGSLGTVPGLGEFPSDTVEISQGSQTTFINSLTVKQPLTQLIKIGDAEDIASADRQISEAELRQARIEVIYAAKRLFYGLVLATRQQATARAAIAAAEAKLREAADAEASGVVLPVAVSGARVELLQARQSLLASQIRSSDLGAELSQLLGLPLDTVYDPVPGELTEKQLPLQQESIVRALATNPKIEAARKQVRKASAGISAARHAYLPDLGLFGTYVHQDGISFLKEDIGMVGLQMTWDIFDWGKKSATKNQRKMQRVQAERHLDQVKQEIEVAVRKIYRKLEQTRMMIAVAREAVDLRRELLRQGKDQLQVQTITAADHAQLQTDLNTAEYNSLKARIAYQLALAELAKMTATDDLE